MMMIMTTMMMNGLSCGSSIHSCHHVQNLPRLKHLVRFHFSTVRQHLKVFLSRSVRSRLCPPDLTELVEAADDKLFQLILENDSHIRSSLLPPNSDNRYNLRIKRYNGNYYLKALICLILILLSAYKDCS